MIPIISIAVAARGLKARIRSGPAELPRPICPRLAAVNSRQSTPRPHLLRTGPAVRALPTVWFCAYHAPERLYRTAAPTASARVSPHRPAPGLAHRARSPRACLTSRPTDNARASNGHQTPFEPPAGGSPAAMTGTSLDSLSGVLSGYGCTELGAYLVLDTAGEGPSWQRRRVKPTNQAMTLQIESEADRFCTGRHDLDRERSEPCPRRARVFGANRLQCAECFGATGFNPAFYHAEEISPQQRRRNQKPHFVYLAWFGPGVTKVGMSYAARGHGRLLEQGARLATRLGVFDDAQTARRLEAGIAERLGLREVIRASRKRHLLGCLIDWSAAERELTEHVERVADAFEETRGEAEILKLDRYYGEPELLSRPLTDLGETRPATISGRCLGLIGDALITEQGARHFLLPLAPLHGARVRLSGETRPNHVAGQLGFGF